MLVVRAMVALIDVVGLSQALSALHGHVCGNSLSWSSCAAILSLVPVPVSFILATVCPAQLAHCVLVLACGYETVGVGLLHLVSVEHGLVV
jgi:hypothetical protein